MKKFAKSVCLFLIAITATCGMQAQASAVPTEVSTYVKGHLKANQTMDSPIINAGSALAGVYVYFATTPQDDGGVIDAHLVFADGSKNWHDVWFDRYYPKAETRRSCPCSLRGQTTIQAPRRNWSYS